MKTFGWIMACVLGFAAVLGLGWVVTGNQFFLYSYFAPKYANVQQKVFENTAPFNQGMALTLRQDQQSYVVADADHKTAIASLIVHDFADYDETNLPPDLRAFYDQIKSTQGLN